MLTLVCSTRDRVVPPSYLMRSVHINVYKSLLRRRLQDNFALIHEIHEGLYDTNHLSADLHKSDLSLPLLVGYVHSVQCHAHSDWTALLVDEMHSVVGTNGPAVCNRGVLCWLEERLVKQHAQWIRPGAVWLLEGANLALFPTNVDGGEEEEQEQQIDTNATNGQQSSDTNLANANSNIDRMILVGESSLVFAWTPEEASSAFTNDELVPLNDRRNNIRMPGPECIAVDFEDETEDDRLSPNPASFVLPEPNDRNTISSESLITDSSSPSRSEEVVTELPDQQPCHSPLPPKLSDGQIHEHGTRGTEGNAKATASESANRRVTDDKSVDQATDEPSSGIPVERVRKRDIPTESDTSCSPSTTVSRQVAREKNTLKSTEQSDQPQQSAHCQVDPIDDGSKQAQDQELTTGLDLLNKETCETDKRKIANDQKGQGLGKSHVRCMTPVEVERPLVSKPPSTGGSFDDMLDEDEDILFNRRKNDKENSALETRPPTKVDHTVASTSIFDDVEDDFLDFLGDDD